MDGERVELHLEVGVRTVRGWQCGQPAGWRFRAVRVGTLADGRWFVEQTGQRGRAVVCRDEAHADQLAAQWMADGEGWEPADLPSRGPGRYGPSPAVPPGTPGG